MNSRFGFQNDGTYPPRITKETRTVEMYIQNSIVIVSKASQSVSITFVNSLKVSVYKQGEFPCVYNAKPSRVLMDSENQNIHQL